MLDRSPIFHILLLGVPGKTCSHPLPPSCQPALGGNGQPLVLTLAVAPGQNPEETVWPLYPPTREDYIQWKGQGSPLAKPCDGSSFIPRIFSFGNHDSKSGHGHPASLKWQTSSASVPSPLRWPWLLGLSDGLPSPQQGLSQQRCPSYPSWGFCSWEVRCLLGQAPPNLIVVCHLSASDSLSGRTQPWQSILPSALAHKAETLVVSWVYIHDSISLWTLLY